MPFKAGRVFPSVFHTLYMKGTTRFVPSYFTTIDIIHIMAPLYGSGAPAQEHIECLGMVNQHIVKHYVVN